MIAAKVEFYVYAENEAEASKLSKTMYEFVDSKRERGIAVTAKALTKALQTYGNNYFLENYLKNNGK